MSNKLAVAIMLGCVAVGAHAESLKAQIEASDKKIEKFLMAKDVKGFTNFLKPSVTKDFVYSEMGHTMSFDKMTAAMAGGLAQMQKMTEAKAKLLSLQQSGNTATATTSHLMSGTVIGQGKKTHIMSFEGTTHDTYVKEGGKWKFAKMVWVTENMKVDGKAVPNEPPAH